jgi:hypothetical protein
MNFGISQIFEKTPKVMVVIGHTLLAISASAAAYSMTTFYPQTSAILSIISVVGTVLTSLFGEKNPKINSIN